MHFPPTPDLAAIAHTYMNACLYKSCHALPRTATYTTLAGCFENNPAPTAKPTSIPLPHRFRRGASRRAPIIPPPSSQPLLCPQFQLPIQLRTRFLPVNEIAEPAPHTSFPAVEPTTRFSEIGDGGQLAVDGAGGVPAAVEGVTGGLGGVFVFEAGVDVADQIYRTIPSADVPLKVCP